jgi:zinc protease
VTSKRSTLSLVALLLTLCFLQTAYGQKASTTAIKIPFETYKLPNGLNFILSVDKTTPTVTVDVWYHVGSKNEIAGRTGFAHLFEHVMFTGSGHVPYGLSSLFINSTHDLLSLHASHTSVPTRWAGSAHSR